mmetsp:Transcript_103444/g.163229  ORF Transcript_103444/g.163229 Transcript_103444/m.163229 type:complete len:207 (+) Transcript_103444:691-1311(+)
MGLPLVQLDNTSASSASILSTSISSLVFGQLRRESRLLSFARFKDKESSTVFTRRNGGLPTLVDLLTRAGEAQGSLIVRGSFREVSPSANVARLTSVEQLSALCRSFSDVFCWKLLRRTILISVTSDVGGLLVWTDGKMHNSRDSFFTSAQSEAEVTATHSPTSIRSLSAERGCGLDMAAPVCLEEFDSERRRLPAIVEFPSSKSC